MRRYWALASMVVMGLGAQPGYAASLVERLGCGDGRFAERAPALPHARAALAEGRLTILAIGSSSTAGTGAKGQGAAYPARTEALLTEIWGKGRIQVAARGVGGERADGALSRLPNAVAETDAALIVWQVGTNDALRRLAPDAVAQTIRDGLAYAQEQHVDILLVDPQFFPRIAAKAHYAAMAERVDAVGDAAGIAVVDRYERMASASAKDLDALLARDKLHMSAAGHDCLARDLSRAITDGLNKE